METWLFRRSTVSPKALWKVWGSCLLCWLIMKFPEVEPKALGTHNPGSNWSVPEGIICLRNRPSFVHLVSEKEEMKFPGEHPRSRRELTLSYSYFGWKSQGPASLGPCPRWFFFITVCVFVFSIRGPCWIYHRAKMCSSFLLPMNTRAMSQGVAKSSVILCSTGFHDIQTGDPGNTQFRERGFHLKCVSREISPSPVIDPECPAYFCFEGSQFPWVLGNFKNHKEEGGLLPILGVPPYR